MDDRRYGGRHMISFPVRVRWKNSEGKEAAGVMIAAVIVGPQGTLVYLPRNLPLVGGKVSLTVTENPEDEVSVTAQVIRLERNASHPQVALQLTDGMRIWKKKVWEVAGAIIASEQPEPLDEW